MRQKARTCKQQPQIKTLAWTLVAALSDSRKNRKHSWGLFSTVNFGFSLLQTHFGQNQVKHPGEWRLLATGWISHDGKQQEASSSSDTSDWSDWTWQTVHPPLLQTLSMGYPYQINIGKSLESAPHGFWSQVRHRPVFKVAIRFTLSLLSRSYILLMMLYRQMPLPVSENTTIIKRFWHLSTTTHAATRGQIFC